MPVQSGKGITACDEGPGTIGDRFAKYGIENSEENRRAYRQVGTVQLGWTLGGCSTSG